ncbi:MAG: porin family protein [Acidobacteriia bacterium]|nr:porin family protein [Terriglobia bacterium]
MQKLSILIAGVILFSLPAAAQEYPKLEIFGGYQLTHLEPSFNASGWNASFAGNANHWFGIAADFSGAYKSGAKLHTFMFGPVFSYRKNERITPFAHALLGGAVASGGGTATAFSIALGGGFDVRVNKQFAVRLVQGDWMLFHSGGIWDKKDARVSAGVVFRF